QAPAASKTALSPDGRLLAVAAADGTVTVWQVDTGRRLHQIKGVAGESVLALGFDRDGRSLSAVSIKALPSEVLYFSFFVEVKDAQTLFKIDDLILPAIKEDEKKEQKQIRVDVVETIELPVQVDAIRTLTFLPDA